MWVGLIQSVEGLNRKKDWPPLRKNYTSSWAGRGNGGVRCCGIVGYNLAEGRAGQTKVRVRSLGFSFGGARQWGPWPGQLPVGTSLDLREGKQLWVGPAGSPGQPSRCHLAFTWLTASPCQERFWLRVWAPNRQATTIRGLKMVRMKKWTLFNNPI